MADPVPAIGSDGCTGWFDVWRGIDISQCCVEHDLAWAANVSQDFVMWLWSNIQLAACFWNVGAYELAIPAFLATSSIGFILFYVVRKSRRSES